MNKFARLIRIICVVVIFSGSVLTLLAEGETLDQEREKLLFREIPIVISASKRAQPITESASTITVISAEDIRRSGVTTIPDVLITVAGIDVQTFFAADQQVGIRGLTGPMNNKLLVLLDGHSMYTELYGAVFWNLLPVSLQEIERIEIIKSPASSIYGANAFCGAINIITKTPEKLNGTTLHLLGGLHETLIGTLMHAGFAFHNKLNYKISTEWAQTHEGQTSTQPNLKVSRFNAQLEYIWGKSGSILLAGGRGHSQNGSFLFGNINSQEDALMHYQNDYFLMDAHYKNLKFRTLLKKEHSEVNYTSQSQSDPSTTSNFNAEVLHTLNFGKTHAILWGLQYKYNYVGDNPNMESSHSQHQWALFVEDEIRLTSQFRITIGARFDEHPLVSGHLSPRSSLLYTPHPNHLLRFSFSQAFRNPTLQDSYSYLNNPSTYPLQTPTGLRNINFTFSRMGSLDLKPERITAYELGYHIVGTNHLALDIDFYYNRYNDFFSNSRQMIYYDANELYPGSPGGVHRKQILTTIQNLGYARGIGCEIAATYRFSDHFSSFLNYSFQEIRDLNDDPFTTSNEKNRIRTEIPRHKLNAGLRFYFLRHFILNSTAHWVAQTQRPQRIGPTTTTTVPDYVLMNCYLAYELWKQKAELGFSIINLFDHQQNEFAPIPRPGIPTPPPTPGRRFTLSLNLKF